MSSSRFAAFGAPAFRRFFVAQLISQTGVWFQTLAVALVVAERTGSAFALSGTAIATFGPTLLFSWVAGRACDRWSPRRIAIAGTALLGATAVGLAAVFAEPELSLPSLYALLAIGGSAATFVRVACQSLVYELVGPERLQNAAIWASLINSAARIVGPGLAGAAIATLGATWSLVINAGLSVVAAVAMATIREAHLVPRRSAPEPGAAARRALPTPVRVVIVLNAVVCFWAMNIAVVLTAIVTLEFAGDATALGLSHTLNAVGAVAAALLLTRLPRVGARLAAAAALGFGAAQLLVAAPAQLVVFLALTPVLGLGLGWFQSAVTTAVQTGSPPAALGRAMGLVNLGSFGTLPIGAIVLGVLIEALDGRGALAVCGLACLVAAVVALLVLRTTGRADQPDSAGQSS